MRLVEVRNGFNTIAMKVKSHILLFFVSLLILCGFSADIGYYGGQGETPVLMLRSDFEAAIKSLPPKELNVTSRISLKDNYIFIVELYKGVHVVDNTNPSHPEIVHFINIPGCVDMTINKRNELFARSAVDLVAIDITNLTDVKEINRERETFSELESIDAYGIPYRFQEGQRPDNTVIVAWKNNEMN